MLFIDFSYFCFYFSLLFVIYITLIPVCFILASEAACLDFKALDDPSTMTEFVSDKFAASSKDIEEVEEGMKKLGLKSASVPDEG